MEDRLGAGMLGIPAPGHDRVLLRGPSEGYAAPAGLPAVIYRVGIQKWSF